MIMASTMAIAMCFYCSMAGMKTMSLLFKEKNLKTVKMFLGIVTRHQGRQLFIEAVTRLVCLFGFYGISTFVGYLMPNPFLYKRTVIQFSQTVLIQTIQFSININFVCIQLNVKIVLF